MRTFSSADAKNHFGELIDAARLAPVAVTKYDKPFVVVMGVEEFERVMALVKPAVKPVKLRPGSKK
jgi:prevent-host-death family protein